MATKFSALQVLSIPELFDIIQGYITPHDLAQCVLVSSDFSTLFTPLLWHTISLTTLKQHIHFTTSVDVQVALLRNSKFVRVIRVWTCKSLRPFMAIKPEDLSSLTALEFSWLTTHVGHATSLTEGVARSAIRDTSNERVAWSVGRREVKRQHTFSMHSSFRKKVLYELYSVRAQVEDGPSQTSRERYHHRKRLLRLQNNEVAPLPVPLIWQRPEIVRAVKEDDKLYEDPKDDQLLILFLSYFPELRIFMSTSLLFLNPDVLKVLGSRLGQMRYLSLTLDDIGRKNRYGALKNLLDQKYPSLERLRLMFSNVRCTDDILSLDQDNSDPGESSFTSEYVAGPILSMKSLMVEDNVFLPHSARIFPQPWLPFLKRCINLTSLTLGHIHHPFLNETASIISESCPLIDNLTLGCVSAVQRQSHQPTDQNMASLFAACSARTEEEVKYPATISLSSILSLASTKRSTGLKLVRLYGIPFPETFPKLEVLNALPNARLRLTRNKGGVNARLLIDSLAIGQWACAETLRVLKVNISGFALSDRELSVPVPTHVTVTPTDPNNQDDTEPIAAVLDTLADLMQTRGVEPSTLQQHVCQHLATLASLQELCLGVEPADELDFRGCLHGVQEDCLDFSLESGLDRLEDLKELRVFSVMRMKHKIRLEEVKWMVEKWPKLEAVPGLLSSTSYNDTHDEKQTLQDEEQHIIHWIRENKPLLKYSNVAPSKGSLQERL
ncbi:hypothetical protein BGZ95_003320 [Linnemannia exigua]|uniref:F-box domain-containing protein n=1 Tax=Linnemannia exigua TaxID=604196 RepID=A0AAD4D4F8_9FUNG|nr:hypothetical protein BGZ95_003320 [Linnemannia exigua]